MNAVACAARTPTDTLLQAWESLHGACASERAYGLLAALWPQLALEQWRQVGLGERDAWLLQLQAMLFGDTLQTLSDCPACGETLETSLPVQQLCAAPSQLPQPRAVHELRHDGYRLQFRLPCGDDLTAIVRTAHADTDTDAAIGALIARCLLDVRHGDATVATDTLPPALRERLGAAMAAADPQADLRIGVRCPACSHAWSARLDIAAYLWDELDDWAQELLADVHLLARHYAWSERDILALAPVRRRFYLDLVQA
ncbi:hypothetical protein HEP74_04001 [Xanthomonas sp. SS]|uniref:T4 family baseplate hub assembly chaperone n=1 Tax=Xanthomonas sp. SS TaxID=2724122 RepID=UPI00163AA120|nr:hypothetical protein [Xanthomonas sp. SS]QNH18825.1 hypothetical protein HEP74_04001 [Xanthomonas sp. SS]